MIAGLIALACQGACTAPQTPSQAAPQPAQAVAPEAPDALTGAELLVVTPEGTEAWTPARLEALPSASVPWSHHGESHEFRGVDLSALCEPSISQRASRDADRATWNRIVVAVGRDGYTALFSAAELRRDWGPTHAYVCWQQDDEPLPAEDGPLRLIVPTDGGGARCVRLLAEIRVIDARPLFPQAPASKP